MFVLQRKVNCPVPVVKFDINSQLNFVVELVLKLLGFGSFCKYNDGCFSWLLLERQGIDGEFAVSHLNHQLGFADEGGLVAAK